MHVGRRLGNPLGRFRPDALAGSPPNVPFLDIRLQDAPTATVSVFVEVERREFLTHLFTDGKYSQTQAVFYTPAETRIAFDLEDTGGGELFTAAIYRRDDPTVVFAFATFSLTGAGPVETASESTVQSITPISGAWYKIQMDFDGAMGDQFTMSFSISGGDTRVGDVEIIADENGNLRKNAVADMTTWSLPLPVNGLTGSGATAYDLTDGDFTGKPMWRFILEFLEQLPGTERHVFTAAYSGPFNSAEGPELPARGILPDCASRRVHLQWNGAPQNLSLIRIESSLDGAPYVESASLDPATNGYVTPELSAGVWRFRIRGVDAAGNLSAVESIGDFAPPIWFEHTDPSEVFTDVAGTTQVLNNQDPVALMTNLGSLVGETLEQATLADRPSFVSNAIDHGAGIILNNLESHMDGGATPATWIGAGQEFDLYTAFLLNDDPPATLPIDDFETTNYWKVFGFEGFFELVVAKFNENYFSDPIYDWNTGDALIARIYTATGTVGVVLPIAVHTTTVIRAAFDGSTLTLQANDEIGTVAVAGELAPTNILVWGEPVAGTGLDAAIGPLVVFPSLLGSSAELLTLLGDDVRCPTAFIIEDVIEAPTNISVSFAGMTGTISGAPSPSASVTEYRLYTNGGTEEFPDFTTPVATSATPGFAIPMTAGLWRIVVRASDGVNEDGNFENRLDIDVVEKTVGLLELKGAEPNPLSLLEVELESAGSITLSGFYRPFAEAANGVSVHVWIVEEDVPIDTTIPPTAIMPIPSHTLGSSETLELTPVTIGPFTQEVPHTIIARVMSSDGDFNDGGQSVITFTPLFSSPLPPFGLKGNTC